MATLNFPCPVCGEPLVAALRFKEEGDPQALERGKTRHFHLQSQRVTCVNDHSWRLMDSELRRVP